MILYESKDRKMEEQALWLDPISKGANALHSLGDGIHSLAFLLALQKAPVLTPLLLLCSFSSGS